ncbi:amino acid permease [Flavobacterium psychrophilum]|uniref:amino acid permease n=1 Tax=Flavobacterium psychrophilum TaxID=96345 RepID=UPI0004F85958|nr:amino acid permease [Flavobacterium psychrophilum]AIN73159.1 amino acid permease [Flavobacterium psychrophilum FPG3]EKT2070097.1 amino acid permease [Flavobacterium psychrophilum]EKT2072230.1 amino acid permease [Flavobacterium psychrophilum]EKT4491658.1 amino acid permease [Flavobacterium psychrophilum]MBF2045199.1 amino acid permease [Flavobacterium psychrophilum]
MSIWKKKSISLLLAEASESEKGLKRTLTAWSLVALGVGAIIGAGLFVRTATAAAQNAGPSVTIAFIIAAIGCALAGLCYAELSSSIPISGSAYTYTYATMGELLAWIIGWDLILEYAVGAATVGIAWSEYLNNLLVNVLHTSPIPYSLSHSPFQISASGEHGIINLPAFFIVAVISLLLIKGTQESAFVNGIIVLVKVSIVIMIIVFGWNFINPINHTPYIPQPSIFIDDSGVGHNYGGIMGILGAAGTVFFAFIGFDAVSTAAQETKNPKRDMPIGILGSLAVCTVLYILFAHVLTGLESVEFFRTSGKEASVANVITSAMVGYEWLAQFVTVAILFGFTSVILVMLLGQSRVFYAMGKDGLLPKAFGDLHSKYKTPYKANLVILVIVGAFAAFVPGDIVGDMTSIGTLFAFILVCVSVIVLRKTDPDMKREFKTPFVPFVPILGVIVCLAMIYGLGWTNWLRLAVWLAIGLIVYFGYSKKNSVLNNPDKK